VARESRSGAWPDVTWGGDDKEDAREARGWRGQVFRDMRTLRTLYTEDPVSVL